MTRPKSITFRGPPEVQQALPLLPLLLLLGPVVQWWMEQQLMCQLGEWAERIEPCRHLHAIADDLAGSTKGRL